ncbi:MAG: hypothetical protein V4706_04655 [Pseudomonadota bacterium]
MPTRLFHPTSFTGDYKVIPVILLAWCVLFIGGLVGHQGSRWVYVVFSVVLTAVLLSGLYRPKSYGYLFLAIFFWLGFWLKLSVHNIFQYDYVEPVGRFDSSPAAWDEALWVATVAGMGLLVGRWLYGAWRGKHHLVLTADSARVPLWYPAHRRMVWMLLMGSIAVLAALNSIYGIQQSGLTPRTILVWPLNGLIYWLLSTGFSMALATILWWDICLKKDISLPVYAVFVEAFLSTMSLLSRGIFLFHLLPAFTGLALNQAQIQWRARASLLRTACIVGLLFVISISVVSTARSYLYQQGQDFRTTTLKRLIRFEVLEGKIPAVEEMILKNEPLEKQLPDIKSHGLRKDLPLPPQLEKLKEERAALAVAIRDERARTDGTLGTSMGQFKLVVSEFAYQMTGGFVDRVSALAVDRWIGIEGVMATVGHPSKSMDLFITALLERSAGDQASRYQVISNSGYGDADASKYRFATLPGATAFFYFSGALWWVFLGMTMLSVAMFIAEHLARRLTGNALLCALVGMNAANAVAQLGVVPRQLLIHFGMIAIAVIGISLVQPRGRT